MTQGAYSVLLIEDKIEDREPLRNYLTDCGYRVQTAADGETGLQLAARKRPHLAVVDLDLPDIHGLEVCRKLRSAPETRDIRIVVATSFDTPEEAYQAGADGYWRKTEDLGILKELLRAQLRNTRPPHQIQISCSVEAGQPVRLDCTGALRLSCSGARIFPPDSRRIAAQCDAVLKREDFRATAKPLGEKLYAELFDGPLLEAYSFTRGWMRETPEQLHLDFRTSSADLELPFELLATDSGKRPEYLVLQHPVSRSIRSFAGHRQPFSASFLEELADNRSPLCCLLIASNTGDLEEVDRELQEIAPILRDAGRNWGLTVEVEILDSVSATRDEVAKRLALRKYHLLHYAGHAHFDPSSPEQSSLLFRDAQDGVKLEASLHARELNVLLGRSDVRFFFLNGCRSAATAGQSALAGGDFLGITDGVLQAGVPAVLGFRVPVNDTSAKKLAVSFYEALAATPDLGTALLRARLAEYARAADDPAWLSTVLVVQS